MRVEYPWTPQACSICKEFDHIDKDCKKGTKVWMSVRKGNANDQGSVQVPRSEVLVAKSSQSGDKSIQDESKSINNPKDVHVSDREMPENDNTPAAVYHPVFAGNGSNQEMSAHFAKPVDISYPILARKSGSVNSFSILGQVTEGIQTKEGGYLVRNRKLT